MLVDGVKATTRDDERNDKPRLTTPAESVPTSRFEVPMLRTRVRVSIGHEPLFIRFESAQRSAMPAAERAVPERNTRP